MHHNNAWRKRNKQQNRTLQRKFGLKFMLCLFEFGFAPETKTHFFFDNMPNGRAFARNCNFWWLQVL